MRNSVSLFKIHYSALNIKIIKFLTIEAMHLGVKHASASITCTKDRTGIP